MFNCAIFQSQWDLQLLLEVKKKTKCTNIQKSNIMKSRSNKAEKQIVEPQKR